MLLLTREQRKALKRIYDRRDIGMTYRQFRKTVQPALGMGCILVMWEGMWLGIETDGYTHS